jgi:hypothetical protein
MGISPGRAKELTSFIMPAKSVALLAEHTSQRKGSFKTRMVRQHGHPDQHNDRHVVLARITDWHESSTGMNHRQALVTDNE